MTSVDGHGANRPRELSNLTDRTRSATRVAEVALVTLVLVLVSAACSGGGGGDDIDPVANGGRGGNDPSADDPEAVEDVVADLLERHDEVVAEALTDPSVAEDEDSELVAELRDLYTSDSEMPDEIVTAWLRDAEQGTSTHPMEVGYPTVASRVVGAVDTVSDSEVRFSLCQERRYAIYDADGQLLEMMPYQEVPGEGAAVRVDGDWLLVRLDTFDDQNECAAEETEDS
jgi:hypothetical protein